MDGRPWRRSKGPGRCRTPRPSGGTIRSSRRSGLWSGSIRARLSWTKRSQLAAVDPAKISPPVQGLHRKPGGYPVSEHPKEGSCHRPSPPTVTHIEFVPAATDPANKERLFRHLQSERKEGVVFKRLSAPYTPGRSNSGGNQLKHKFYANLSAVVAVIFICKTTHPASMPATTRMGPQPLTCTTMYGSSEARWTLALTSIRIRPP